MVRQAVAHRRIMDVPHIDRRPIRPARHPLKQMHLLRLPVIDSAKILPAPERPVDRQRPQSQHPLEFIQKIQRRTRWTVQLVHKCENRYPPASAYLKELQRLRFNPLACINDHDRRINRRQHPVRVLREIFVPRRIQQIHTAPAILKLQHRRGNGNAALALQLHPVTRGRPLVFARGDAAGQLHRAAIQKKFLGQCRLARIRVGNDRKCPPTPHLPRGPGRISTGVSGGGQSAGLVNGWGKIRVRHRKLLPIAATAARCNHWVQRSLCRCRPPACQSPPPPSSQPATAPDLDPAPAFHLQIRRTRAHSASPTPM